MAYKKIREQAQEAVLDWRAENEEWEDAIEFESYDPSTNCVFVQAGEDFEADVVSPLEETLRDSIQGDIVVGVVKAP